MAQRLTGGSAGLGIPNSRGVLLRRREHASPVRIESGATNSAPVSQWLADRLSAVGIPEPCRAVLSYRYHTLRIRAKVRCNEFARVFQGSTDEPAALDVRHLHHAVGGRGQGTSPVRAEIHGLRFYQRLASGPILAAPDPG